MNRDRICCAMDARFFMSNGKTLIRELAIVTNEKLLCFQVDTKITHMNFRDLKTNWFIQNFITGLSLRPKHCYTSQKQARRILRQEYYTSRRHEKDCVVIKNHQLGSLLNDMCIPYICLDACAKDKGWACIFHTEGAGCHTCALKKACDLYIHVSSASDVHGSTSFQWICYSSQR